MKDRTDQSSFKKDFKKDLLDREAKAKNPGSYPHEKPSFIDEDTNETLEPMVKKMIKKDDFDD